MINHEFFTGTALYLPYLTLQMVQVGLSIEEIAIVYSVLPFVTCVMPPLAGKFYWHKMKLIPTKENLDQVW